MQIPPVNYNCYFDPFGKQIHTQITSSVNWMIQVGCFYDICFRLADSIPQDVLQRRIQNAEYIQNHLEEEPSHRENSLYLTLTEIWKDRNYGECLLGISQVRDIVAQEILSHDEVECQIGAFVIMGNHLHLILKMLGLHSPYELITLIKNKTARSMNQFLSRTGQRWMRGEYNHIIRSPYDLKRRLKYLKENPQGMNIPVYERPDDRLFSPYTTPQTESASEEQKDYYSRLWRIY